MLNFIRKQFIDVIQWENPDEDTLVWRVSRLPTRKSKTVRA